MKHQLPILPAPGPGRLHSTFCVYGFDYSEIGISHFSEHNALKVHVRSCNASEFPSSLIINPVISSLAHRVFIAARGLSPALVSGSSSLVAAWGLLTVVVSSVAEHGL